MLIFLPFLILGVSSSIGAPVPDGPVKIGLSLDSSGFADMASEKLRSLSDSALQKATAVNSLVTSNLATVGDTLSAGYEAVSDTFNTGYSTISETVKSGISTAGGLVSQQVEAVSNLAKSKMEAVGDLAKRKMEAVSDLAGQGSDLVRSASSGIASGVENISNQKSVIVGDIVNQARGLAAPVGVFDDRPRKIESAVLEHEDLGSKTSSVGENIGAFIAGIFQPMPIVDTITEEEKYGNTGDKFESVGRALVTGSESLANFVSNAVNVPFDAFKQITRTASSKLNNLGARLIGL